MAEEGHKVSLHVYDLSQGLARQISMSFLGKAIEGIWHTGLVVYGTEYYFGSGIQQAPVGTTPYGTPLRVMDLGVTNVTKDAFESYLEEISPRYTAETYNLLTHNCNNFSNEVVQFLVGATIPDYILNLPNEVMDSPMGPLIMPMLQNLETTLRAGAVPQAPQFTPAAVVPAAMPENVAAASSESGQSQPSEESKAEKTGPKPENAAVSAADPLGNARSQIQEEIAKEFADVMAGGTLGASEAAALATKKVMQKHGFMNPAPS